MKHLILAASLLAASPALATEPCKVSDGNPYVWVIRTNATEVYWATFVAASRDDAREVMKYFLTTGLDLGSPRAVKVGLRLYLRNEGVQEQDEVSIAKTGMTSVRRVTCIGE